MTAGELTIDFDEPYFGGGGSGVVAGQLPPWMIALNGRRYLLDTESGKYTRRGIDVLQQRNTTNQRDILLLPQDVWRQQMESWHQGAGQTNLDRDEALPYRFYRSYGIDPWTRYQLSLLNETRQMMALSTDDPTFLHVHNGELVVVSGNMTTWFADASATAVTLAIPGTEKAISTTYDGDAVLILCEDGKVYAASDKLTIGERIIVVPSTPSTPNDIVDATFIAYVKDYLILGVGNQLWDITSTTKAVLIYTSPVTGFTWKGATDGNSAIYLVGGAGDKHVIHRVSVADDGLKLNPAIVAATLPDGEDAVSIGSYLGYVFVGSIVGLRMASPSNAAGDLLLGALLPSAAPVYGFEGQGTYVWATASSINPVPDQGPIPGFPTAPVCGLYRMDLSTFTVSDSTPAYATDIVSQHETGKTVQSVTTWLGGRAFAVNDGGVYYETDVKMEGGWLSNGRVSFSVEDTKTGLYVQAKWEPLRGTVALDLSYDNAPPSRVLNWSLKDSIRSGNISLNGAQFSRVDPRYVLYRDASDSKLGPTFTRFEVRARAVKGAASRWTLPIINHEELDLNGIPTSRDVTEEFFLLMKLVESGIMFPLQEWGRTYQVVVKDFEWEPQRLNQGGTGWQGVFLMIVEEVR